MLAGWHLTENAKMTTHNTCSNFQCAKTGRHEVNVLPHAVQSSHNESLNIYIDTRMPVRWTGKVPIPQNSRQPCTQQTYLQMKYILCLMYRLAVRTKSSKLSKTKKNTSSTKKKSATRINSRFLQLISNYYTHETVYNVLNNWYNEYWFPEIIFFSIIHYFQFDWIFAIRQMNLISSFKKFVEQPYGQCRRDSNKLVKIHKNPKTETK